MKCAGSQEWRKRGGRGGREGQRQLGIDLQFHGSHNLHLIISCSLFLPLPGDDLAGESFNQLLTGPRGCQHLWHVQQQQQHIGTLRMSQIVKAQFLYQAKARGNAWKSSALDK